MGRAIFIGAICLSLALIGVSGVHAHLPGPASAEDPSATHLQHSHGGHLTHSHHESSDHHAQSDAHGAKFLALVDASHFQSHEHGGDIDIDPLVKAFGTLLLFCLFAAAATSCSLILLLGPPPSQLLRVAPPLRPPKIRLSFHLLPPSHAPPFTALSR